MPIDLDEYPIHQAPVSMASVATSDRNFYDRCYFNAHDRNGKLFFASGLGVYPNLGVIDAYAVARLGERQFIFHASDASSADRMRQQVGPYRIEVLEPLRKLRLVCDAPAQGMACDMVFEGTFPAVDEDLHTVRDRTTGRILLNAQRLAQFGCWSGMLEVGGERFDIIPSEYLGFRDRSWGIRPVGEAEPAGRDPSWQDPAFGLLWSYLTLQFTDYSLLIIVHEDGSGHRFFSQCTRIWPASSGRAPEQMGWPYFKVRYRTGTRMIQDASVRITTPQGEPLLVELEHAGPLMAMTLGPGYTGDKDWTHGVWRGRDFVEQRIYDMSDPEILAQLQLPFGNIEYPMRAACGGDIGYGMFEHSCIGRHLPSGFADLMAVAP